MTSECAKWIDINKKSEFKVVLLQIFEEEPNMKTYLIYLVSSCSPVSFNSCIFHSALHFHIMLCESTGLRTVQYEH